jgi:hypothetical protein
LKNLFRGVAFVKWCSLYQPPHDKRNPHRKSHFIRESGYERNPHDATVLSGAETTAFSSAPNNCLPCSPKPYAGDTGGTAVTGIALPAGCVLNFFRFRIDAAAAREYYKK